MALIGRLIGSLLKRGQITLVMPDGKRATYGPGGGKSLTISVADRRVPFELMRNPRLAIGESYMDGRLVIEDGTILDLLELVVSNNRWEEGGNSRKAIKKGKRRFKWLWSRNRAAKSKRNVAHHYDLKDELYELFLDDDRQYSCAYFTDPANSLEQAQTDKKAHIAAKLYLKPGQRVLDIGCGWGSFAIHAAARHGVKVVGITLSPPQVERGQRRADELGLGDQVDLRVADYRDLTDEPFDAVASIGMVEHVGANQIDVYARQVARLVKPGGRILNHGIARLRTTDPEAGAFSERYVFPDAAPLHLSRIQLALERAGIETEHVEGFRMDYAETLKHWARNLDEHHEQALRLAGPERLRVWRLYLRAARRGFESGFTSIYQVRGRRS